jgi:hypothetical protein
MVQCLARARGVSNASTVGIDTRATRHAERMPELLMIGGATYTTRFVLDLAKHIHDVRRFRLSSLGLQDKEAARSEIPSDLFVRQYSFPETPQRPRTLRQNTGLFGLALTAALLGGTLEPDREYSEGARVKRPFKRTIERRVQILRMQRALLPAIAGYDLYHYNCIEPSYLGLLSLLPPDKKVVLSVWGSDLLRTAGVSEYADQFAGCHRANVITVTSLEVREVLLAKFGRDLAPKIRLGLLGVTLLDEIDECRGQRAEFLKMVGLPDDCMTVCVGNNASRGNQHMDVLHQLKRVKREYLDRIAVVLPVSYRPNNIYVAELRALTAQLGLRCVILDRQMSNREVALLRCGTDLLIHVPISDAFSAAMLESLYAGSALITGAWLPYSRFRASGVNYHEVFDLADLPALVTRLVDSWDLERQKAAANRSRIWDMVHPTKAISGWLALYDELLASRATRVAL